MLTLYTFPPAFAAEGEDDTSESLSLNPKTVSIEAGNTATITATYTGPATGDIVWSINDEKIISLVTDSGDDNSEDDNTGSGDENTEGDNTGSGDNTDAQAEDGSDSTESDGSGSGDTESGGSGSDSGNTGSSTKTSTITIKGLTAGATAISASAGGVADECTVTVTASTKLKTVEISETQDLVLEKGAEKIITALITPSTAKDELKWESSSANVASVTADLKNSKKATVKGLSPGRSSVSVVNAEGTVKCSAPLNVIVSGVTLALSNPSKPINAGSTATVLMTRYGSATENALASSDWEWDSDNPSVAQAVASGASTGQIIARSPGTAVISCKSENGSYSAELEVTILSATAGAINVSLSNNQIQFSDILSKLESKCKDETNSSLKYLTNISVPTEQGTLYYGYVSIDNTGAGVATAKEYYRSPSTGQLDLKKITFIPQKGYTGNVLISYTGYSSDGLSYTGMLSTTVTATNANRISYSSVEGSVIRFQASDFSKYCQSINGQEIDSVSFTTPNSRYGYFYYNYTATANDRTNVDSDETFYRTKSPSIDKLSFVPDKDYSGSFSISFSGKDTAGADIRGAVYITLGNDSSSSSGSSSSNSSLTYYCRPGERVYFETSDFSSTCEDKNDAQFDYVRFDQPTSHGDLYYDDDDLVDTDIRFYRTGSRRRVDDVYFEADSNYTGTVYVPFICYDVNGNRFSGDVRIKVSNSSYSSSGTVSYSCRPGGRVYFNDSDFSDVSYDKTDRQLDYVRFSLPSSSRGVLYYDGDDKVSSSTSFFRSGSNRLIDDVSFVADDDFSGTVFFSFTGYNTNGRSFSGTVKITVSGSASSSSVSNDLTVTYESNGLGVLFRTLDFSTACNNALNSQLSYIEITSLPRTDSGRLYINYKSPAQYIVFDKNQVYSVTGTPSISQISFVPRAGFTGTVYLDYTGTGVNGEHCSGDIRINVTQPVLSSYFEDMWGAVWSIPSVDFMRAYNIVEGTSKTLFSPTKPMKRGDYILMLQRIFRFEGGSESTGYRDVPRDSYYADAIYAARAEGVLDENRYFYPEAAITREKAAVYLYKSLRISGRSISPGSYSDISPFLDAELVSSDAVEALGALVKLGVFVGDDFQRLNPTLSLNRAQLATILHRALTL